MENDPTLIELGLRLRQARAYEKRQWWKLFKINEWLFVFRFTYLALMLSCTTIDPGGCRVHESTPTPIIEKTFTATAVLTSSCTWCGRDPVTNR